MRAAIFVLSFVSLSVAAQQPLPSVAPIPMAAPPVDTVPDPRWNNVLKVHPGELVEFRDKLSGQHTECVLHRVDEAALVCESDDNSAPRGYVVYPQAVIDRVWVFRSVQESNRKWVFIAAGAGALIGAVYGSYYGTGGAVIGGGLGLSLGGECALKGQGNRIVTKRRQIYAHR